ncbi:unannotated protein [freshwater metagenome]|uniref:Unannotated protein n=1 Tax=freshwater metagenome TaxID=449393 RepID=A0A6J7E0N6_9ZZZZ|nr:ComEA family DNA-binding protein [Actinomycetota bacterium]
MHPLPDRPPPSRPISETMHAWLQWFGVARLAVTALAVLGVGAGGYWLLRSPPTAVESTLPYAAPAGPTSIHSSVGPTPSTSLVSSASTNPVPPPPPQEAVQHEILVYVTGAVMSPGVYRLAADSRIQQAIAAAGGPGIDADLDAMNLAATMRDGDRVYVPHRGQAVPAEVGASGSGASAPPISVGPTGPVDLNRATVEQLDALPGIGPATAAAIVNHREQRGPFSSIDDLLDVPGIGPAKLDAIRALVTV